MSDVDGHRVFWKRRRNLRRFFSVAQRRWIIHLSYTTPSLALGTIDFGKPLPPPLLPCRRVSLAACAASQELYVLMPAWASVVPDCW